MDLRSPWPADELERLDSCPLCGSSERRIVYEGLADVVYGVAQGTWALMACRPCGAAYLDPRPNRTSIVRAYRSYATHAEPDESLSVPKTMLRRWRRRSRNGYANDNYGYALEPASRIGGKILSLLPPQSRAIDRWIHHLPRPKPAGRLLDVGCGNGAWLLQMQRLGWEVSGIDFDSGAVRVARNAGVDAHESTLDHAPFETASFDAIALSHVLEHFHDPNHEMGHVRELLKPGGMVWIATPNWCSAGHRLLGRDWRGLEIPRHLVLFQRLTLNRLLENSGFCRIEFHAPPPWAEFYFEEARRHCRAESRAALNLRTTWLVRLAVDALALAKPDTSDELIVTAVRRDA